MAGRDDRTAMTEFVNTKIVEILDPLPSDVVLDIGCGDGCLLRKLQGKVSHVIGTLPTPEEQRRLQAVLPDADIRLGHLQKLPVDSGTVSKVVCNSVFVLLGSTEAAGAALAEIARVAKPGATVFVGEVPEVDEAAALGFYRGGSVLGLLLFLLRHQGLRSFLGMCKRVVMSCFGRHEIVMHPYGFFYARPDEFLAVAGQRGLSIVQYFRHEEACDDMGTPTFSRFRYDYLFRKA